MAHEEKGITPENSNTSQGWISVKDRLPEAYQEVIVCNKSLLVTSGYIDVDGKWFFYDAGLDPIYPVIKDNPIIRWQPFPRP